MSSISSTRVILVLGPRGGETAISTVAASSKSRAKASAPQRDDLADYVLAAFAANPVAGARFDSIAQFYRSAYLRYIDATKRRTERMAEGLLSSPPASRNDPRADQHTVDPRVRGDGPTTRTISLLTVAPLHPRGCGCPKCNEMFRRST
jgi:hypothetical protein